MMRTPILPAGRRPDMDIRADALDAIGLLGTANSTGMDVAVSVLEGELTLTGYIRSEMVAPGIEQAVQSVAGLSGLVNQLIDDSSLVRRLAAALSLDQRTRTIPPGYQIVSNLGHTLVVGTFDGEMSAAISEVCTGLAGVRSVQIRRPGQAGAIC